jgi:hypothetical protein
MLRPGRLLLKNADCPTRNKKPPARLLRKKQARSRPVSTVAQDLA